jgi:hypothetical protein
MLKSLRNFTFRPESLERVHREKAPQEAVCPSELTKLRAALSSLQRSLFFLQEVGRASWPNHAFLPNNRNRALPVWEVFAQGAIVSSKKTSGLHVAQNGCQQICRNNCGYNSDGSVNGGFNELERANACYKRCLQQCMRN